MSRKGREGGKGKGKNEEGKKQIIKKASVLLSFF